MLSAYLWGLGVAHVIVDEELGIRYLEVDWDGDGGEDEVAPI